MLIGIDFVGNKSIPSSELLDHIATAPTSGFLSKTVRYYDTDLFAIDLKRIVRWYNEKGFYVAKVTGVDVTPDEKGRVRLAVHIEEGRRAYVKDVWFVDTDGVAPDEMADIDGALGLHRGDPFDEDQYEKSKDDLVDQLKQRGFAEAQVSGQVKVAPEESTAAIATRRAPCSSRSSASTTWERSRACGSRSSRWATARSRRCA